jgi:cation transport ATPase
MAKNKGYDPSDFGQRQENIRKAKGNPNKNVHSKKKNSNYKGFPQPAKASERLQEQSRRRRKESIFTMPPAVWAVFFVALAAMIVLMILNSTTYKGNQTVSFLSSLATGATCCVLAYNGYVNKKRGVEATTFQTVLLVLLAVLGVLYVVIGGMGLSGFLKA